ncbi:MAG: hypothetical protein Q8Q49_05130 [bacterium]|nr:hypothetical protein [bacterium]
MNAWKAKIHLVSKEFFQYSLTTYLLLLLAETLKEGFVSYFFNLNILLGIVIISGIVMAIMQTRMLEENPPKKMTSADLEYSLLLAIGGGMLVYYKTKELGNIALLIAVLTAFIILLLSFLILLDGEEK